jgi:ubiquinone/menaquinone biosynthesis C-methylase UbiE
MTTVDNASSDASFKDHFSGHSSSYAEYRPRYPDALFSFLADCCSRHELAWDCATGNGQAASALTPHFEHVIASDASEEQIQAAESHPKIEYRIAKAEASGLDDDAIDLITVAQAMHWFDIHGFLDETQRVLAPGGVLAIWSYEKCLVDPECDRLINELYVDIVGDYWPPERKLVADGYRSIELPMPMITAPEFAMKIHWSAEEMLGYLRTWSASQRYLKEHGVDPVSLIEDRLCAVWGEGSREVSWPLNLKIGRA